MKRDAPPQLRCAVYTRVSSDSGLEQEFNSLDNQREAAEAYIKSQAHEGWRCLPARYDDGGYSGGSIDRPALQLLLEAIQARRIDVVVVYKVDRLTRSLPDFAKLVELFDAHAVSFVSVTQAFNTTSSMGRLTLNVLLSFAQFEREVTGERIRDKIAASKRRGIWMGGVVPLGYRVEARKLLVDEGEAATVRLIFERYLALGSLPTLQRELRQRGVITRSRILSSGRAVGGVPLTNGPLAHLLRNRVYLGEINHRGTSHPGEHAAIIPSDLFEAVQVKLSANLAVRRNGYAQSGALLIGRIFDDRGNRMTPSYAVKNGMRYRYYVSSVLAQGRKEEAGTVSRIAAAEIETKVVGAMRSTIKEEIDDRELVHRLVERVTVHADRVEIAMGEGHREPIVLPFLPQLFRRKREMIAPPQGDQDWMQRPMKSEDRDRILQAIARARIWAEDLVTGAIGNTKVLAHRERCDERSIRRTLSLASLSPKIVQGIVDGLVPRGVNVASLTELPIGWTEQHTHLGI